jgi:hypothetical protein
MILSHLPSKDLARSQVVLKHWQRSSLVTVVSRRKSFLYLDPHKEYILYDSNAKQSGFWESFTLLREPCPSSRSIHEPHPVFMPYSNFDVRLYLEINKIPYETLRAVDPAAFLFQPPLNKILVSYEYTSYGLELYATGGMTFGRLLTEIDAMHAERLPSSGDKEGTIRLLHSGAIDSNSEVVKKAREARAKAVADAVNDQTKAEPTV